MIDVMYNVQKWDDKECEWVDRSDDGSDWYSNEGDAKYFCRDYQRYQNEKCRVVKVEVVYG